MLNFSKIKVFYDNYKLIFGYYVIYNDNIIQFKSAVYYQHNITNCCLYFFVSKRTGWFI